MMGKTIQKHSLRVHLLSTKKIIILSILFFLQSINSNSQTEIIQAGSIVIDMGVVPQTEGNALKPYGLVFSLINDYFTPIVWSVNPNKVKDGVDFTVDGRDFKGGTFIIRKEYITAGVLAEVAVWEAQGVVTYTTQTTLLVPLLKDLQFFANWVIDTDNEAIAIPYLVAAGIPQTSYTVALPTELDECDDLFILPHADPTWTDHGAPLLNFTNSEANGGNQGWVWSGCHAVSVLEALSDPNNSSIRTNFLSLDPVPPPTVNNPEQDGFGLINFGDHDDASGTTAQYQTAFPRDPFMQFMGTTYGAHEGGSEQIFIPNTGGGWRPTTKIAAWDPNQNDITDFTDKGRAAMIAYGYAFGDPDAGQVMYEGGHRLDNGTAEENIAAIRAFLNFSFDAPQNKAPRFLDNSIDIPVVLEGGEALDFDVEGVAFDDTNIDYLWVDTCGGLFVDELTGQPNYTAPIVNEETICVISAIATDRCNRKSLLKWNITIVAPDSAPTAVDDSKTVFSSNSITFNALTNDTDPNDDIDPATFEILTPGFTNNQLIVAGEGTFIDNGNGSITFIPETGFTGQVTTQLTYRVSDETALVSNIATITITVQADPAGLNCTGQFQSVGQTSSIVNAVSASGSAKDLNNATGSTPGTHAEIDEGEDLTLGLSSDAPANSDFTVFYNDMKNDSEIQIELLAADGTTIVQDLGTVTTTSFGSNTYTATSNWRFIRFTQLGTGRNGKGDVEYIEAVELIPTCIDDRDGDLIADSIDLDDDNDGILDTVEGEGTACVTGGDIFAVTTDLGFVGNIATLHDGTLVQQNYYFDNNQAYDNQKPEIFKIQFDQIIQLSEIKILLQFDGNQNSFIDAGVQYKWQGSNDDTNWTDITGATTQAQRALTGVELTNVEEIFDLSSNTTQYLYYRLFWIAGSQIVWDPWIEEIVFTEATCVPTGATDTDGDGVPDYWDLDSDNDGIPDNIEAQTTQGYIAPSGAFSSVGIDIAYGNGLTPVNTDNDSEPDYLDLDSDNEGDFDIVESGSGLIADINGRIDNVVPGNNGLHSSLDNGDAYTDVNGIYDNTQQDNFPDADGDVNGGGDVDWRDDQVGADTDGDGILDDVDLDDDNDGILDTVEIGDNDDPFLDTDNDGTFDYLDSDTVGFVDTNTDGVDDRFDPDLDGIINQFDLDSDGDGIPDNIEAQTTLGFIPSNADTAQNYIDNNGVNSAYLGGLNPVNTDLTDNPDYLDLNSDNKTGNDTLEGGIFLSGVIGANGLDNAYSNGTYTDVNGFFDDTQVDNFPDDDGDVNLGGDVDWRDAVGGIDTDGDTVLDTQDLDDDNDGIIDTIENGGVNPLLDSDVDGIFNYLDPDTPGFLDVNTDGVDDRFDIDLDGIIDQYDLDSDGDGCPDAIEGTNGTFTKYDLNANNRLLGGVSLVEDNTYGIPLVVATGQGAGTSRLVGSQSDYCTVGDAMITQIYHSSLGRVIEVTNITTDSEYTIPASKIRVSLYSNTTGSQSGKDVSSTYTIPGALAPGQSALLKTGSLTGISIISNPLETTISGITDYAGDNDIIVLAKTTNNTTWDNRYDIASRFADNTSYVRIDNATTVSKVYHAADWVAFVDDTLDPYRDLDQGGPQRHPHDPLLSEVHSPNANANNGLGLHRVGPTTTTASDWDNGYPDRSREVIVNQNFTQSTARLSARKLAVNNGSKLTVTDNLLVVTNDITLTTANDEIRLAGGSHLVQTHKTTEQINGLGKLYVDQNSEVPNIYRYNYLSSPVNTIGATTYRVADVLKDGTIPTSSSSNAVDINFISGYNGSIGTPINIAHYWIYTYASTGGGRSGWTQKLSTGVIPQTDGFIFKGPGRPQNYTFVGTPKDGTLTTAIGGSEAYLVGNPYASAISSKKFIEDNINTIYGTLYFWEHVDEENATGTAGHNYNGYVGGYATRNIAMGVSANEVASNDNSNDGTPSIGDGVYKAPENYIPIGQGFFVTGDNDGGNIIFNNSQREHKLEGDNSTFFRNSTNESNTQNLLPIIKLGMDYMNADNIELHRQIGISFKQNNSFDFDKGYDSYLFDLSGTDIYWQFPGSEAKYVIAGVEELTNDLEVPIAIQIEFDGEFEIAIDEWQNINRDVFLKDNVTNIIYQINDDNKATLNLIAGNYIDRFVIVFGESSLSTGDNIIQDGFNIYADNNAKEIVIVNKNNLTIKKIELFNILGQEVKHWSNLEDNLSSRLSVNSLKEGVYIVKISTDSKEISKKILLFR